VNELNLQERLKGPLNATDSAKEKIFCMKVAYLKNRRNTHTNTHINTYIYTHTHTHTIFIHYTQYEIRPTA